jgi:protocatechuate 3,4-dioxygenase beta subunit
VNRRETNEEPQVSELDKKYLMTRRRSLALFGTGASGLLLGGALRGTTAANAQSAEGNDYVAGAATACTLTAEQEEGPFYVGLENVREDIVSGQAGLPVTLEITVINSLTCKPLKNAAVDIWHCNASGVYSDITSESSFGKTYLRGVQITDKHGQVTFKTVFPGHYQGRTTHIHVRVHINSHEGTAKLSGGHVAHTGQMFPPDAVYAEVYKLAPYKTETATVVTHAQDAVWTQQHGAEQLMTVNQVGNRLAKGLIASVVIAVNPSATPALIGATSTASIVDGKGGGTSGPGGSGGPPAGGSRSSGGPPTGASA